MNNGNTLFWKNISFLRGYYEESQEQLAESLRNKGRPIKSRSTISQWEKGIRYPDDETIKAVAEHYDVTVQDLLHSDFSKCIQENNSLKPNVSNRIDLYLPIFEPDTPSSNSHFETAYKIQKKMV